MYSANGPMQARGRHYCQSVLLLALFLTGMGYIASSMADTVEQAPAKDSGLNMETVQVTATRRPTTLFDVSEAITVIESASITTQAPNVVAEMLRGQTGTFFQQTTPGQGIPIIRGLKGSEVLHLVDGMRLNNAFFRNAPNQYLGLVDAFAVDRMEVVRGSAPSLYGADAMGGVLQVITTEPEFANDAWQSTGRFYGSFDSVDEAVSGRASAVTGKSGNVISGGFTVQDFGNRKTGDGTVVQPTAYKVKAGDLKWRKDIGSHSELMLSAQILEQPSTPRIDELVPGFGQTTPSSRIYEFQPNRRAFMHARYRLEGQTRWFEQMEIHVARQVITDDRLTQDFDSSILTEEVNESTLDGLTLQFNTALGDADSIRQDLVWGLEIYQDSVNSNRRRNHSDDGSFSSSRGRFPDDSSMDSIALYASNRWDWDSFSLEAGLRYSKFDIVLPSANGVAEGRLKPDDLTGDIHLSWEVQPGFKLVSNIGRGFRPPNIFDLGTLGSRPGNRFNIPNPDLKPESVWSYDFGFKSSGSNWNSEFYVFYLDYQDKITSVLTGDVTEEGRLVVQSANLNSAKLYGIESSFRWFATEQINLFAVLNYTRGEERDVQTGSTVAADRVPPLNGRIGFNFNPHSSINWQGWIDFADQQDRLSPRDIRDPRINPQGTQSHFTLNMLLGWQISEDFELGIRLENLTNKLYREHGSGIDAPGRNIGFWFDFGF